MNDRKVVKKESTKTDNMIAKFMSASAPMEAYFQQGKPLTNKQLELISVTLTGLQTFFTTWKRKHGRSQTTFLNSFSKKS